MDTQIYSEVDKYISKLFIHEDEALLCVEKTLREANLPYSTVSPNQGKFLHWYIFLRLFLTFAFSISICSLKGQGSSNYLRQNAIRVDDPNKLSDPVYNLLSLFQIIMMGEMHGTNEPAQFVIGLANLLTEKGDSISVGLEIPSEKMANFIASHTDSSIYQSYFFNDLPILDGRETFAWASIISKLKNNPKAQIFFLM